MITGTSVKELRAVLSRCIGAIENPADLTEGEIAAVVEDAAAMVEGLGG